MTSSGFLEIAEVGPDLTVPCHPLQIERQALNRDGWGSDASAQDQRGAMPSMPMASPGTHTPTALSSPKEPLEDTVQPDGIGTVHEIDEGVAVRNAEFQHHERVQGVTHDEAVCGHASWSFASREDGQGVIMTMSWRS